MDMDKTMREYIIKFDELTERNQKYVLAVQQALIFTQTDEDTASDSTRHNKQSPNDIK